MALVASQFVCALVAVCFVPAWWGYSLAAICLCLALIFLSGPFFPRTFVRGICPLQDGFEVWRPLRKPLFIAYADVERVMAISRGEGDEGNDLSFLVFTASLSVPVSESDLYGAGVLEQLQVLPGFVPSELRNALRYEARTLNLFIGKKFTIYESRLPSNT